VTAWSILAVMIPEVPSPPPLLPADEIKARPWGTWATVGWTIVIMLAALAAQVIAMIVMAAVLAARGTKVDPQSIGSDGNFLAVATCGSGLAAIGLSLLFAAVRRGITVKEYLALSLPSPKEFGKYLAFLLFFVLVSDGITVMLGRPIVPEFMMETYQSTTWGVPLLLLVLLVTAPLSEEFLFRGFMFAGLLRSPLGVIGTIIVTSLVWAGIHLQYDMYGIFVIFILGLFLGFVRYKTGSMWLCVILHSIMNLIATIELMVLLSIAPDLVAHAETVVPNFSACQIQQL
jgi:membrane protease YdiL (CAAX protease family)